MRWTKIFFVVALALCSCSIKEDINERRLSYKLSFKPVFNNYNNAGATKSCNLSDKDSQILGSRFLGMLGSDSLFISVSADEVEKPHITKSIYGAQEDLRKFYVTALLDGGTAKYMDMVEYTSASSGVWESSPEYYWPKENTLSFFAYGLSAELASFAPEQTISQGVCSTSFTYTLPLPDSNEKKDAQTQPDIIVAISPNNSATSEAVGLDFYHTGSAVRFKIGDMPEDVVIKGAVIGLSNVKSAGKCVVSYPVSDNSIVWSDASTSSDNDYYQTYGTPGDDGILGDASQVFSMIPQPFGDASTSKILISLLIGDKYYYGFEIDLNSFKVGDTSHEWEQGMRYTYTISKSGGDLEVGISETATSVVKENVFLQNTGWVTSNVRAAVVGFWAVTGSDGVEEIVASWDINDPVAGTLEKNSEWGTYWEIGKDGFYYYKYNLLPGQFTKVALFDKYELKKTTGPVAGSKLKIMIVAQAIEKEKSANYWTTR